MARKAIGRAECIQRKTASQGGSTTPTSSLPIFLAMTDDVPMEILQIPELSLNVPQLHEHAICCGVSHEFVGNHGEDNGVKGSLIDKMTRDLRHKMLPHRDALPPNAVCSKDNTQESSHEPLTFESPEKLCETHFASAGTIGVVELGASQTVVGSKQVTELLQGLPANIRAQVRRTPCQLTFRFGNHQTLTSKHALLFPFCGQWFRIAVVPGQTPFLLSSSFLKQIRAVIDTDEGTLHSKVLQRNLSMERSNKNLFLMDLNQLWTDPESRDGDAQTLLADSGPKGEKGVKACSPCVVSCRETQFRDVDNQPGHQESSVNACEQRVCTVDSRSKGLASSSFPDTSDVQPSRTVPCHAQGDSAHRQLRGTGSDDPRRTLHREGDVRGVQERAHIRTGISGHKMDGVHLESLREEFQAGTSNVREVCRVEAQEHGSGHQDHHGHQQSQVQGGEDPGREFSGRSSSSRCL